MRTERQAIFIHGAGGGGWEWERWIPVFRCCGYNTTAPDLVPAPRGLEATRFEDYLAQIVSLLPDAAAHTPPVLIGASMGGLLALKAAEYARVAAVVLVNSTPSAGTPGWPVWIQAFPPWIPWSTRPLESTRASLRDADEDTIRWAHAHWRDESGAVMAALYQGIPAQCPAVPVLVITSRDDDDVPVSVSLALAERLAADVMVFAGVSHVDALLGKRAALIAKLSCDWIERVIT
jgi:pimeloyl-ACP methyl ester carboxylesterase